MKLGEKIKQLRQQAELTQPELAVKAGIEQSYLSKLENDKGSPSFDVIAKIAQAFDMDAMSLIESLDANYLHEQLSHLPEVAIKIESKRQAQMAKMRSAYIAATIAIVIGVMMVLAGNTRSLFSEVVYQYQSKGLINKGEPNRQFNTGFLDELNEDSAAAYKRKEANKTRLDEMIVTTRNYMGESFVEHYGQKRRYFRLTGHKEVGSTFRELCLILGFACLVGGGLFMGYTFRFLSPTKTGN